MTLSAWSDLLAQGFCVAVLVLALGYVAVRQQRLFLGLFMVLTALKTTRDFAPTLVATRSGMNFFPEDLFTVVALGAALARIGKWRLHGASRAAATTFAVLVGVGVLSWVSSYDLQTGVNSWRNKALAVALLAYATTRPRRWSWRDLRTIVVVPSVLAALASGIGLLVSGIGSSSETINVDGVIEGGRPIAASGALLMLVGLWMAAFSVRRASVRHLLVLLLGGMVLLTQHRSVWVAAILSVVAWWTLPRVHLRRGSQPSGVARTLVVLTAGTLTVLVGASLASLGQSARDGRTWSWRVERWGDSMSISRSSIEWLVGATFGPTPASLPTRFLTSAHSEYVDGIESVGLVGAAAILALLLAARRGRVASSPAPIGLVLCFAFLGFGVAYQLPPWAWVVIGVLLSSTSATRTASGPPEKSGQDMASALRSPETAPMLHSA